MEVSKVRKSRKRGVSNLQKPKQKIRQLRKIPITQTI